MSLRLGLRLPGYAVTLMERHPRLSHWEWNRGYVGPVLVNDHKRLPSNVAMTTPFLSRHALRALDCLAVGGARVGKQNADLVQVEIAVFEQME